MKTISIGGKAGEGIKSLGKLIAETLSELGYYICVLDDYPSLITGGHNFNRITFDNKKIHSHYRKSDILVALDKETVSRHKKFLKKDGFIIYNSSAFNCSGKNCIGIPAEEFVNKFGGKKIMNNTAVAGAVFSRMGVDFKTVEKTLKKVYGERAELNIKISKASYDFFSKNFNSGSMLKKSGTPKKIATGNEALAMGAEKAGLDIYIAYPMTPATSLLHFYAGKSNCIKAIQPESEISVINMALGSSYAGAKTMIGTSGGGFALMTEALSFSGMAEIPLVIVESQRPGPGTGVPTYTGQSDLNFVLNAGHGEFPRIVIAPGTNEQAFSYAGDAMNLAWKFQVPAIILVDKHLSESLTTIEKIDEKTKNEKIKPASGKNYVRYKIFKNGISPVAFPGTRDTIVKATSYEHTEDGITTEEPEEIKKMQEKRFRKIKEIEKEIQKKKTIQTYGNGKNVIVTWGSTTGAVIEAVKEIKDVKILQVIYMCPFPNKEVLKNLKNAKKIICVEANYSGQLSELIKLKTGIEIKNKISKYDSREFEPEELCKEIKRCFK